MQATKLNDWMQVIGIFAVVASLIFVGLEMRQAQEISLSQAYQSRTNAVVEWNTALATNPAALAAQRKAANGAVDEITTEEYDALRAMIIGVFNLYDNAHYQYQKGFVSQEFWHKVRGNMKNELENPVASAIFLERVERGVRPDFRDVVLKISKELEAQPDT